MNSFQELLAFLGRNPLLSLGLAAITALLVVTEVMQLFRGYASLKPAGLVKLINDEDALVVDLSASGDFEKGHIAGSRNVAGSQFDPAGKLFAGVAKTRPVVVLCRNGTASAAAARKLKKAGFERVAWLDGGIAAWQAADLPLAKKGR